MLVPTEYPTAIANYIMALGLVMLLSVVVTEMFHDQARVTQQDKLDNYGHFLKAALVKQAKGEIKIE